MLWSTSWVLIKLGLRANLPALTFAGLRYSLGFVCLCPFILLNPHLRAGLKGIRRGVLRQLALLGVVCYTITQSAQFISLSYLPTATVSLVLNLTPVMVALLTSFLSREKPYLIQWVGVLLAMLGVLSYFLPVDIPAQQSIGVVVVLICLMSNAFTSLLGRWVNRDSQLPPSLVTFVSMGIGSALMLGIGLATQGIGRLGWQEWAIIGWLAVVNTALAFTLWNNTLRTLTAVESSILNSTMLPQVAFLAWLFLGEGLSFRKIAGIGLVVLGVLVVQLRRAVLK